MIKQKIRSSALFFTVFAFFSAAVFVSTGSLKAADPSGVHVTVFKTELFRDAAATPVLVFSNPAGKTVDMVGNPDVFGRGTGIPVGTYKRIRFTVKNAITISGPNPDPVACVMDGQTVTKTHLLDGDLPPDAEVELNFATGDDGGSAGDPIKLGDPVFMQNAVEVKANEATVVEMNVNTANAIECGSGNIVVLQPITMNTINYVEKSAPAACLAMGEFWMVYYRVDAHLRDDNGNLITNPTPTQIMQSAWTVAGWGTAAFSPPDANGRGTWTSNFDQTYADGGMAEHRHALASLCGPNQDYCANDEGYFNPGSISMPDKPSPATGIYILSNGKMILYFPDGGYIQGGMTDDCNLFVGADIGTFESSSLIYAVRKRVGTPGGLPSDSKYLLVGSEVNLYYSDTTDSNGRYPALNISLDRNISAMDTGTGARFKWKSRYNFYPDIAFGTWGYGSPIEDAFAGTIPAFSSTSNGLLDSAETEDFIAIGANDHLLVAGTRFDKHQTGNHRIGAALGLSVHAAPIMSDAAGKWIVSVMESRIEDGGDGWSNGNERPEFGITYGEIDITATDAATGSLCIKHLTYRDSFSGRIESLTGECLDLELATECYAFNEDTNQGLPITTAPESCVIPGTSAAGIVMPVFYGKDATSKEIGIKFSLDKKKKAMAVWKSIDNDGKPFYAGAVAAGDANHSAMTGAGIRVE